ncbi:hypothetical protein N5079_14875 [Planotetraspora sp. A-T 1434]|uniref:hypothetical protein n=1 Tax=Planotetraspora sp. A-T 1434 TaxID=2979219 RepID=UPI0021BF226B|nr:hypothetical protein [Planotetraspora sp. A-T 1434]MCT9931500.1 hypothetical protein [Planotetraspora sp. A-T 1434]
MVVHDDDSSAVALFLDELGQVGQHGEAVFPAFPALEQMIIGLYPGGEEPEAAVGAEMDLGLLGLT